MSDEWFMQMAQTALYLWTCKNHLCGWSDLFTLKCAKYLFHQLILYWIESIPTEIFFFLDLWNNKTGLNFKVTLCFYLEDLSAELKLFSIRQSSKFFIWLISDLAFRFSVFWLIFVIWCASKKTKISFDLNFLEFRKFFKK